MEQKESAMTYMFSSATTTVEAIFGSEPTPPEYSADEVLRVAFHSLARERKMSLAMRGLPVANVLADDLYDKALAAQIPEEGWSAFVHRELPSPRTVSEGRGLERAANMLAKSLHGDDDVDVETLIEGGNEFVRFVEAMGSFAAVSVKEARVNLDKIDTAVRVSSSGGPSMAALLEMEARTGMHGAGGVLKDESAAMGLLWLGRLLSFWMQVCVLRQAAAASGGATNATFRQTFRQSLEAAYEIILLPFHGFVTQQAFAVAVAAVPEWETVWPLFAPTEAEYASDAAAYIDVTRRLVARVNSKLEELDLVDTRKSL